MVFIKVNIIKLFSLITKSKKFIINLFSSFSLLGHMVDISVKIFLNMIFIIMSQILRIFSDPQQRKHAHVANGHPYYQIDGHGVL